MTASLAVAIAACVAAGIALGIALVLWRRTSRLVATQSVVLGQASGDLLEFAVSLQGRIDDLYRAVDEVAAGLSRVDRRVDGAVTNTAVVRYDAYEGTGGQQSASVALLDATRTGAVVTAIQGRDYARIYVKDLDRGARRSRSRPRSRRPSTARWRADSVEAGEGRRAGNVLLQVFRTSHAVGALLQHAVAGTGVSADEWAVLSVIGVMRSASPTDLSQQLRVPPTSISRHVSRLASAGLVGRAPNPSDGRSYLLELTEDGRSKVQTIAPRFRAIVDDLRAHAPVDDIELALVELERAAKAVDLDKSTAGR